MSTDEVWTYDRDGWPRDHFLIRFDQATGEEWLASAAWSWTCGDE